MGLTLDDYINYGVSPDKITGEMMWSLKDYMDELHTQGNSILLRTLCIGEESATIESTVKHIICVHTGSSDDFWVYRYYKWEKLGNNIDSFDVSRYGMLASEVNAIRPEAWATILEGAKTVDINSYFTNPFQTQKSSTELTISRMEMLFKPEILTGSFVCTTQPFYTTMWKNIKSICPTESGTGNTRIRYTVSSDKFGYACVWDKRAKRWVKAPVTNDSVLSSGMAASDFDDLPQEALDALLGNVLSFNAVMSVDDPNAFCQFCAFTVEHETWEKVIRSNPTHTISDSKTYNQYRWDTDIDTYILEVVEGVGFENVNEEDDFYTTPNKIILKAMPLGTLIGTRRSIVYKCELANTFKGRYLHCKLTMSYGGFKAIDQDDGTCRLTDSADMRYATLGELSVSGPSESVFKAEYPLEFDVAPSSDNLFYFRLTPTLATVGEVNAQIVAVTSEISEEEYNNSDRKLPLNTSAKTN